MSDPVVVHLITSLERGGAESMLAKLAVALHGRGMRHVVVSIGDLGPLGGPLLAAGVPVYGLGFKRGRPSLGGFFRLLSILRTEQPDILQTWLYHADLLGLLAGRLARVPRIVWNVRCSNMDMRRYSRLSAWVLRGLAWASSRPAAVVVNSEAGKQAHIALGYRPKRWQLIPNGIDCEQYRPDPSLRAAARRALGLGDDEIVFVMVARVDPMKNHAGFLAAAGKLKAKAPFKARFVLIGRDAKPNNLQLARASNEAGLGESVRMLGERADLSELLPAFDVLVLPSLFGEGFSNVLGEAMAAGLSCIATDVGDAAMIVGDAGIIIPPADPVALAAAMLDLGGMEASARAALGSRARERIAANFALGAILARYEAFYRELLTGGTG